MTHIGSGDRGQRYEISYVATDGVRRTFGWSDTLEGAGVLCRSIVLNPSMSFPTICHRNTGASIPYAG